MRRLSLSFVSLLILAILAGCASEQDSRQVWVRAQGGLDGGPAQRRLDGVVPPFVQRCVGGGVAVRVLNSGQPCAYGWNNGEIYLTRGLVALLDDEELLAAVAHELGHFLRDGHVQSVVSLRGCSSGADEESAADRVGVELLRTQGLDAGAMVRMLSKVARVEATPPACRRALQQRIETLSDR